MGNRESTDREPAPGRAAPNTVRADVDVDHIQKLCHAADYDVDEFLVTRRGTEFPLTLHTQTHLTVEKATIAHESGNEIAVTVGEQRTRRTGTVVKLTIPANAAIGVYVLSISGKFEDGTAFEVSIKRKVVVLFNAWCTEDGVYVEDEDYRKEFVLNSSGRLYAGSHTGMPWNLALYRPDSLRAVMFIMENVVNLTFDQRRNPILVGREMSAVVNIQDENGILVGRWDGDYGDERAPTSWRGSGEILQKYYKSGGEPVRYGQCWVFSGVLLSVLRILGIPSRSVTNFSSAHDTNRNRTIDEYYDQSGEKVYYLSSGSDSVWNFHVWNEAWMARPDLPAGFDGWQVLDATPQEESPQGGGYRTGPAPVKAIKDGNSVVYDTNFVIAEVNADIKKYIIEEHGAPRLFKVQMTAVGKTISTKAVGGSRRHDITHEYKHPEGSERERAALYKGYEELMDAQYDVEFEIPEIKHKFGEDVHFQVNVTNTARIQRIQGKVLCEAVTYTGRVLREVKKLVVDTKVGKGKTERIKMTIDGAVFSEFPRTKVYLRFDVLLAVTGTSQVFSEKVNVAPEPPELQIDAPKRIVVGDEAAVTVRFKNPLPVKMDDVTINVESDELLHDDITDNIGTIGPGAEITYPFKIVGLKLGKFQLVVGLDSDKVELVTGEAEVEVVEVIEEPDSPPPVPPPLEVVKVDSNIQENRRAHHTDRYEESGLIIRRGQSFSLTITTKEPQSGKIVTRGAFRLKSKRSGAPSFQVDAVSVDVQGKSFKIDIKPPGNVPIGLYTLILTLDNGRNVVVLEDRIKVIILFNPWSIEDSSHYPEVSELDEYVLNNRGRIWVGSSYSNYGRPWQFAQFKKDSLEVALWILDKLKSFQDRADVVKVTRHLSAWANVQDDNGIVVGNWSGDYEGGESPLSWTGSAEILAEYNRTHSGVRYGQCWVFSGVQTSLLRCVGLAARSVTNFNSAHDTHFNRAIDKFFDEEGEEISTGDSIWNFHVWNEAWMARPDLPAGFGGWQALDATPQEESPQGGGYRLGPCPVHAVKLGHRVNFDVEFVISEVNADIRYYTIHDDKSRELTRTNTTHVGKKISTKAVGTSARNDLTLDYKYEEGSTSERAALLADSEGERSIGLTLSVDDTVMIGQDFYVRAELTNKTRQVKKFRLKLLGRAVLYTGAPGQQVKASEEYYTLKGGESTEMVLHVMPADYLRILEGGYFINFVAMAFIPADKLSVVRTREFRLLTPDIAITLPEGGLKLHHAATIKVEFKNPLSKRLRRGKFYLHGEGFVQDTITEISPVAPNGTAAAELLTIPLRTGEVDLVVRFTSDQLTDLLGDAEAVVAP